MAIPPIQSWSTPAMMCSRVDITDPFRPEDSDLGAAAEAERDITQDLFVVGGMDAANAHHRVDDFLGVCGHGGS